MRSSGARPLTDPVAAYLAAYPDRRKAAAAIWADVAERARELGNAIAAHGPAVRGTTTYAEEVAELVAELVDLASLPDAPDGRRRVGPAGERVRRAWREAAARADAIEQALRRRVASLRRGACEDPPAPRTATDGMLPPRVDRHAATVDVETVSALLASVGRVYALVGGS